MLVFNLSLNMSNVNLSVIEFQIQTSIKKMEIPSRIKKFADKVTANLLPVKYAGRYEAEYQKFINVNRLFNCAKLYQPKFV
jgi:hypothetical protein